MIHVRNPVYELSLTTRGHISPRTTVSIIHCINNNSHHTPLDFPFLSAEYCLAFITVITTLRPIALQFGYCLPQPGLLLMFTDYLFCQALWIFLAVDRSCPFRILLLPCPQYTCFPWSEPCLFNNHISK